MFNDYHNLRQTNLKINYLVDELVFSQIMIKHMVTSNSSIIVYYKEPALLILLRYEKFHNPESYSF